MGTAGFALMENENVQFYPMLMFLMLTAISGF
jgi:hypothetical protein